MLEKRPRSLLSAFCTLVLSMGCGTADSIDVIQQRLLTPRIDRLTRPICSANGGCIMTIVGLDFNETDAEVFVDKLEAKPAPGMPWSKTQIHVVVPELPLGSRGILNQWRDVSVKNGPGYTNTLSRSFLYYDDSSPKYSIPRSPELPFSAVDTLSGDVNCDGRPDLLALSASGDVAALIATGARSYAPAVVTSTGISGSFGLTVGDMNGDNKLDVVVGHTHQGVSVLLGNCTGNFTSTRYSWDPSKVAIADVNLDGAPDVVGLEPSSNRVMIFYGFLRGTRPTGQLYLARILYLPTNMQSPRDLRVVDINDDNKPEIVVAGDGGLLVALNTMGAAIGGVACSEPYLDSPGYRKLLRPMKNVLAVHALDLNGDKLKDLVAVEDASQDAQVITQNRDGSFSTPTNYEVGAVFGSIASADLNFDGCNDLIFNSSAKSPTDTAAVLYNRSAAPGTCTGSLQTPFVLVNLGVAGDELRVGDLDSNGIPDLMLANPLIPVSPTDRKYLALLYGASSSGTPVTFEPAVGFSSGDSGSILAATAPFRTVMGENFFATVDQSHNRLRMFKQEPDGTLKVTPNSVTTGLGPHLISTALINNDAYNDLIVGNYLGNSLSIFMGDGSSVFGTPVLIPLVSPTGSPLRPLALAVGDFDGNGKQDAAVLAATSDLKSVYLTLLRNDGMGMLVFKSTQAVNEKSRTLLLGNVLGDAKDDVIVSNASGKQVNIWVYNAMTGLPTTPTQTINLAGDAVGLHAINDVNDDARSELLVVTNAPSAGNNVRVFLSGMTTAVDADELAFGSCTLPTSSMLGDLDNDGDGDLLISCPDLSRGLRSQIWLNVGLGYFGKVAGELSRLGGMITLFDGSPGWPGLVGIDEQPGRLYVLKSQ